MKVVCIFPVAKNQNNIPKITAYFLNNIIPHLELLGATKIELKFASTDYIYVATNKVLEGEPKGKGILQSLKNVDSTPDIVIVCDGSGAIPYKYISEIFQELVSDSSICSVMANRVGYNKSISTLRYLIERFEVFLLKKHHHYQGNIPDGQCGLWGYRYGKLSSNGNLGEIQLTAEGYEIELDLLGETLRNNLNFSFIDVVLPPRKAPSSFTYNNNLKKMQFLTTKYEKLKDCLLEYLKDFEETTDFSSLIDSEEGLKEKWENYKKDILNINKK